MTIIEEFVTRDARDKRLAELKGRKHVSKFTTSKLLKLVEITPEGEKHKLIGRMFYCLSIGV